MGENHLVPINVTSVERALTHSSVYFFLIRLKESGYLIEREQVFTLPPIAVTFCVFVLQLFEIPYDREDDDRDDDDVSVLSQVSAADR